MDLITVRCVDGAERVAQVLDVSEVVALEQRIAEDGTPLLELMKRAGCALANTVMAHAAGGSVVVLAGSGNNGGDGWVAARILADDGYDVAVVTKVVPAELQAEPARTAALEALAGSGFEMIVDPEKVELAALLDSASVIVDAILGTGFAHDEVREPYATWIELANAARERGDVLVVSADCPSGLNAQTGARASQCVVADVTVTMLAPKRGLMAPTATPYVGELLLAPLS